MMRVTDLEKFALEQIWRPYHTLSGLHFEVQMKSIPVSLEETAERLRADTEWSRCVLGRLRGIRVRFPEYIVHPLVDAVRDGIAAVRPPAQAAEDGGRG